MVGQASPPVCMDIAEDRTDRSSVSENVYSGDVGFPFSWLEV